MRLPKVELHIHLEGAIPLPALWQLIEKYDGVDEVGSMEALTERFRFRDFSHFIETFRWKNKFLQEYDDFAFIAAETACELADQGIRYVELFYSPGHFARRGMCLQRLSAAIRQGLDTQADRITVKLIADLIRDFGPEQGLTWLRELAEMKQAGLIGIGIGGNEQHYPPQPYEPVYQEARQLGLRTTAHAGEAAGVESIWGAVRNLAVDRIGHGTRAEEDPRLMDYLATHQVPLELCPLSNVKTGVVPSIEAHPVRRYFERGLLVSINSDDPSLFQTSLLDEFEGLMDTFDFTLQEVGVLTRNAIRSAWCDDDMKTTLSHELEVWTVTYVSHTAQASGFSESV